MNTITQRLTAGFAAAIASAITLGAAISLFTTPVHAEDFERAPQSVIGATAARQ